MSYKWVMSGTTIFSGLRVSNGLKLTRPCPKEKVFIQFHLLSHQSSGSSIYPIFIFMFVLCHLVLNPLEFFLSPFIDVCYHPIFSNACASFQSLSIPILLAHESSSGVPFKYTNNFGPFYLERAILNHTFNSLTLHQSVQLVSCHLPFFVPGEQRIGS